SNRRTPISTTRRHQAARPEQSLSAHTDAAAAPCGTGATVERRVPAYPDRNPFLVPPCRRFAPSPLPPGRDSSRNGSDRAVLAPNPELATTLGDPVIAQLARSVQGLQSTLVSGHYVDIDTTNPLPC